MQQTTDFTIGFKVLLINFEQCLYYVFFLLIMLKLKKNLSQYNRPVKGVGF